MGIAILFAAVSQRAAADAPGRNSAKTATSGDGSLLDTLTLREVTVKANFSDIKSSALRLVTLDSNKLKERASARTFPELMRGITSLYATSESGSYGDAKLNIRGFGQDNISVLLNGIPISGLVTGSMYWNNWMGLADATCAIQVQKGVGASLLSDGSVGGSVNILTESPSETAGGEAGVIVSHFGTAKGYFKIDSGSLPRGWSFNLMGSYVGGNGYVDATKVNSFAYMLNLCKRFNNAHSLIFTALGSPEEHEQRNTRLSSAEVDKYGLGYNKNWGMLFGQAFNLNKNNYFKPYFTLQHIWNGERMTMKNAVYVAVGNGGGRWSETNGKPLTSYTGADGQIDFYSALAANRNPDGSSVHILTEYMAGHTHAGAVSTLEYKLGQGFSIGAGIHAQLYHTWEREQITDLLGGDFWYEDYANKSLAGQAGRVSEKKVGDYVRTENGKHIYHGTAYVSAVYDSKWVNVNLGLSLFGATVQRWDSYNYVSDDIWSKVTGGVGGSVKGGVLLKAARGHSIYANAGWYSRLPYSNVWFSSGNNEVTRDVRNERNTLGELGWRWVWGSGNMELTGYAAYWKNKSLMSGKYKQLDADEARYMVTGLDALHCGVELSVFQKVGKWLEFNAFASIGDWRWHNDVQAVIYDDYSGVEIGKVNVYCDGLPVADAPQTQIGSDVKFLIPMGFSIGVNWQFNDRMYAEFDPLGRTDPDDRQASYRIPGYHLLGADIAWKGNWSHYSVTLFAQGNNLLGTRYIERGKDGASHDLESFRGFWGLGRNFTFGLRFGF